MTCNECEADFEWDKARSKIGGLRKHCHDCAEETTIPYVGVTAGEGKMNSVQVLKFESAEDREAYMDMWWVNSGMMVGKSCQLGIRKSTPNVKFKTVLTNNPNANHKGKG